MRPYGIALLLALASSVALAAPTNNDSLDKAITCTTVGDVTASFVAEWSSSISNSLFFNGKRYTDEDMLNYRNGKPITSGRISVGIKNTTIWMDNTSIADMAEVRKIYFEIDRVSGTGVWYDGPSKFKIQCKPGKATMF